MDSDVIRAIEKINIDCRDASASKEYEIKKPETPQCEETSLLVAPINANNLEQSVKCKRVTGGKLVLNKGCKGQKKECTLLFSIQRRRLQNSLQNPKA